MLAPVGRRAGVGVHDWLVTVGILQQREQLQERSWNFIEMSERTAD